MSDRHNGMGPWEENEREFERETTSNEIEKDISSWSGNFDYIDEKALRNELKGMGHSHYMEEKPEKQHRHCHCKVDGCEDQPNTETNGSIKAKKDPDRGLKIFLISLMVIIGSVALIFGASAFTSFLSSDSRFNFFKQNSNDNQESSAVFSTNDIPEGEVAKSAEEIYQKIAPSIVGVVTYNPSAGLISSATGQGSGIIMSEDGYVVTNAHVIGNSNKYNVSVVTSDHKEHTAKVVGYDTRTDLAVLKIEASGLTAAEFGNSDQLAVGATVLAIGNPGGLEFSNSLTRGIVSALNRTVKASNSTVKYIQTDAAINPGNSGGALVNVYGQVIGINTAKLSEYEAMGLAIPSNTAKTVIDDILGKGYVTGRVKMGITVRALSAYEAQINNVPQGLVVMEITNGNNFGANGLKAGDIITKFNGVDTRSTSALYAELSKCSPGTTAKLTVYRMATIRSEEGSTIEVDVTLIEDKGETQ